MEEPIALSSSEQKDIVSLVEELFVKLGVESGVSIQEQDEMLDVLLDTEESGMLIGYHGEILEALQLVISLMIAKKTGRFIRVSLEIGDYKKNRTAYLERLAMQTKDAVLDEGREHTISSLKSWERRVVHMMLQNDEEVTSESVGEGRDRVLIVRPRA